MLYDKKQPTLKDKILEQAGMQTQEKLKTKKRKEEVVEPSRSKKKSKKKKRYE